MRTSVEEVYDTSRVSLVWGSGMDYVRVPKSMGEPRKDQLQGTVLEQLAELAGRVCYDSLGQGRSSEDYHKHILEVKHTSVYGHCVFTVNATHVGDYNSILEAVVNRPGVILRRHGNRVLVTANIRSVIEWRQHGVQNPVNSDFVNNFWRNMEYVLLDVAPVVAHYKGIRKRISNYGMPALHTVIPNNLSDSEVWSVFWLEGSRGFSHELVRHGYQTSISQRSTRYVDESETDWAMHPLLSEYVLEECDKDEQFSIQVGQLIRDARGVYSEAYNRLADWLYRTGRVSTQVLANKQARGAARGYLGNALKTQLIFGASLEQWNRIFDQRINDAADAEINGIISDVRHALSKFYSEC